MLPRRRTTGTTALLEQVTLPCGTNEVQYGRRRPIGIDVTGWGASSTVLPKLDIYKPIWELDADTLGKDLSAHLRYGAGITCAAARRA